MLIQFFNNESDANVINKQLLPLVSFPLRLKNNIDLINPIILLKRDPVNDFMGANYCYIDALERYYFIDDISNHSGMIYQLSLSCDVLETYKNDILSSNARYKRNIKTGDYFDASLDKSIFETVKLFESNVTLADEKSLILTTVGA